jgi:hypothetical protein
VKKIYLLLFIATPIFVQAQKEEKTDSVSYYSRQMSQYLRTNWDSLRNTPIYKALQNRYEYHVSRTNDYSSFVMLFDVVHNDYKDFNKQLMAEGFPELKDAGLRFGFGASTRTNRILVDMYFVTVGINNKSTKGNETIRTALTNAFQWEIGYDVLNAKNVAIYPYGGIAFRWSYIKYEKKQEPNPNYTSVFDIRSDGSDYTLNSNRLGFQAGIGFDFTVAQNEKRTGKTILFVKAGMNRPVWKDTYRSKDVPAFKPNIIQGDWLLTIGIKFADKH